MTLEASVGLEERDHLSRLNALLVLAMLMTESTDEQQILRMGASAAPSFADCRLVGVRVREGASARWTSSASAAQTRSSASRLKSQSWPASSKQRFF